MGVEGAKPYDTESSIQDNIKNGKQPAFDEGSTSESCVQEKDTPYHEEGDFEPILEPTFDKDGNQIGFEIPENQDPDNLCPTQDELEKAYE